MQVYLFDFVVTANFVVGAALVIASTFLYGHICKICPKDFYCASETITELPNGVACQLNSKTTGRGADEKSDCQCDAGFLLTYEAANPMLCVECLPGQRCGSGDVEAELCHLENRMPSADHTSCICDIGHEEDANFHCVTCQPGYVKDVTGNQLSTLCPDGMVWFNETTGVPCREHSTSTADRLNCNCDAPRILFGDACSLCGSNQYYASGLCLSCPDHSTSVSGASDIQECACDAGYVFDVSVCVACEAGTYENNDACVSCGVNAHSLAASDSVDDCVCNTTTCQQFVYSDECVGSCEVAPVPCTPCEAGDIKAQASTIGNTEVCVECAVDTYQDIVGQTSCHDCHETRTNVHKTRTSAVFCECRRGYGSTSTTGACDACVQGHYKADHGNALCAECDIGQFISVTAATACFNCWSEVNVVGANTTLTSGSTTVDSCVCDRGLYRNNDQCELCLRGSYKDLKGMHPCTLCGVTPLHHYGRDETGAITHDHCLPCPQHSGQDVSLVNSENLMNEQADCLCFPGHDTWTVSSCVACDSYEFKTGFNNNQCSFCASGYYFVHVNQPCQPCNLMDGVNSSHRHELNVLNTLDSQLTWGTSESDCTCDLGYIRISDVENDYCQGCPQGTFRNDPLSLNCTECALDHYQDQIGMTVCLDCPDNSHTNDTAKQFITDCLCDAGYELHDSEHRCVTCQPGYYATKGSNVCQACPENTFSEGTASSLSLIHI